MRVRNHFPARGGPAQFVVRRSYLVARRFIPHLRKEEKGDKEEKGGGKRGQATFQGSLRAQDGEDIGDRCDLGLPLW